MQTLHVKAAADGDGLIVRLLSASDATQEAAVGSALFAITGADVRPAGTGRRRSVRAGQPGHAEPAAAAHGCAAHPRRH
ncbi:MAG: hypothetical protein R2838_17135 [Caldilineaceae bacterium]